MAKKEDNVAFNGDGTSTYWGMTGLLNAAADGAIASMTSDDWEDITVDNLVSAIAALQDYGEAGAKWYVNRKPYFKGFVGAALGTGGVNAEEVRQNAFRGQRTYLGYPVVLSNACTGTAAATTLFGVFGDIDVSAKFGQRRGLEIAQSTEVYFATDQIGIRGTQRVDFVVHDVGTASVAGGYVALKTGSAD